MTAKQFFNGLLIGAVAILNWGCSGGFQSASSSNALSALSSVTPKTGPSVNAGLAKFQSGLYAFAQTANCSQCHAAAVSPTFAAADVNTAYNSAKALVSMTSPDASVFIAYSGNGHCGVASCQAATNPANVQALLEAWATAETTGSTTTGPTTGTVARYLTQAQTVPATIPLSTSGSSAIMRFDLSRLNIAVPSLAAATLEIEIQYFDANKSEYRILKPKLVNNTAAINLQGIHVYLKTISQTTPGLEDINGVAWDTANLTVPITKVTTLPATTPINVTPLETTADAVQVQSSTDQITIGFDTLN